ncbi:MAG TPA: GPW/gp25 family protein [Jatrophihabitans sp.]|jgi:phage baseplate assembly protein W|nr:GPW/gp25 family protein [Jatrophihabitans sp.]
MSEPPPPRTDNRLQYDPTFIGRGFSWPLTVDHTGGIRLTEDVEDIERAMRIILLTAPGERVMRPRFGCRIWDLLFEPITPNLLGLIDEAVTEALAQWEPRIDVLSVDPTPERQTDGLVLVRVQYRVRTTNDRRNLVFPFYVIPHDGE